MSKALTAVLVAILARLDLVDVLLGAGLALLALGVGLEKGAPLALVVAGGVSVLIGLIALLKGDRA